MFSFREKKPHHFDFSQLKADMHSHLIPGIDDGAPDLKTSLELVRAMVDLGYRKLITTPHVMQDMYKNTKEDIMSGYKILEQAVKEEGIPVEISASAEYFLDDYVKELLNKNEPLLTISQNMVLVEFSLAHEPFDLKEILFELQLQGYQPVIAHPERYLYPRGRIFFDELKDSGYLFQLNILSLTGMYGKEVHKNAQYLAGKEYYEFAGTDLHHRHHLQALHDPAIVSAMKRILASGKLINDQL